MKAHQIGRSILTSIVFLGVAINVQCQNVYDTYLDSNSCEPKEYLELLFQQNDLIIICEREHPEMTQYDFFYEIVSQQWFIDEVGTILCEVPTRSIQTEIDDYLFSENLSEEDAEKKLMHIYRNIDISILWTKTNFYCFLKNVYTLNQSLEKNRKIRIIGVDVEFSWQNINNHLEYIKLRESFNSRDRDMAEFILQWYTNAERENRKAKALIIMNYRHAYMNKYWTTSKIQEANNVGRYIKDVYPEKSTNIYLNSFTYTKVFDMPKLQQNGKWDKAFKRNENTPIGFSLTDSPFGEDDFDYFPYIKTDLKWKDVFEHMIFYNPVKEFVNSYGINGIIDENFKKELHRRYRIAQIKLKKKNINSFNTEKSKRVKTLQLF